MGQAPCVQILVSSLNSCMTWSEISNLFKLFFFFCKMGITIIIMLISQGLFRISNEIMYEKCYEIICNKKSYEIICNKKSLDCKNEVSVYSFTYIRKVPTLLELVFKFELLCKNNILLELIKHVFMFGVQRRTNVRKNK